MAADPEASPIVQLPEEYSYWNLFQSLFTSDADARAEACKDIVSRLQLAAGATPSEPVTDPEPFLTEQGATLLNFHKYAVARLATECPFPDVRNAFSAVLPLIPKVDLPRSPSRFVAPAQTPSVTPTDPATRQLFEDIFVNSGRVLHLEQLLGWHPRFLSVWSETMDSVMRSDGPLLQPLRHYIALMACSRYSCEYLINVQEQFFLESGGDPSWLQGIKSASPKIQALAELNAFLAHQPWMLRKEHIAALVKGRSADGSPVHHENLWSIAELVHAAVILCTFHSLCGFVFGMGVTPEIEAGSRLSAAVYPFESEPTAEEQSANATTNNETDRLMELLTQSQDGKSSEAPPSSDASSSFAAVDMDPHTAVTYKDSALSGPSSSPTSPLARSSDRTPEAVSHAERYSGGIPMTYENFDCKSDRYTVFRSHEYSWKEHGIPLLNRFYENMGNLLDTELDLIYDLTYGKVSTTENVDTTPYRRALWYYVSRLYGVSYEDYDYRQVNGFLGIPVKSFVKKVACHPETIAFHDFRNMNITFSVDEKCHVCLLAVESRKQCCLLYALYAIMRFMS